MFLMQAQDKLEIKIVMGGNPKETEMLKFLNGLGPARLLACQLLPLLLGWIACCFRVIFGRKDWPTFKALIVVSVVLSSCLWLYHLYFFHSDRYLQTKLVDVCC